MAITASIEQNLSTGKTHEFLDFWRFFDRFHRRACIIASHPHFGSFSDPRESDRNGYGTGPSSISWAEQIREARLPEVVELLQARRCFLPCRSRHALLGNPRRSSAEVIIKTSLSLSLSLDLAFLHTRRHLARHFCLCSKCNRLMGYSATITRHRAPLGDADRYNAQGIQDVA
jgi:hypothetical protein